MRSDGVGIIRFVLFGHGNAKVGDFIDADGGAYLGLVVVIAGLMVAGALWRGQPLGFDPTYVLWLLIGAAWGHTRAQVFNKLEKS